MQYICIYGITYCPQYEVVPKKGSNTFNTIDAKDCILLKQSYKIKIEECECQTRAELSEFIIA